MIVKMAVDILEVLFSKALELVKQWLFMQLIYVVLIISAVLALIAAVIWAL